MGYMDELARHARSLPTKKVMDEADKAIGGLLRDRQNMARTVGRKGVFSLSDLDAILIILLALRRIAGGDRSDIVLTDAPIVLAPLPGAERETPN
jgi:hypothetical protein